MTYFDGMIQNMIEDTNVFMLIAAEHASIARISREQEQEGTPSRYAFRYNANEAAYWAKKARVNLFQLIGDGCQEDDVVFA